MLPCTQAGLLTTVIRVFDLESAVRAFLSWPSTVEKGCICLTEEEKSAIQSQFKMTFPLTRRDFAGLFDQSNQECHLPKSQLLVGVSACFIEKWGFASHKTAFKFLYSFNYENF